jgi:hypothetical protein
MYVLMYLQMYVLMYLQMYVLMYLQMYVGTYVPTNVCRYLCTYICKYLCIYIPMYVLILMIRDYLKHWPSFFDWRLKGVFPEVEKVSLKNLHTYICTYVNESIRRRRFIVCQQRLFIKLMFQLNELPVSWVSGYWADYWNYKRESNSPLLQVSTYVLYFKVT